MKINLSGTSATALLYNYFVNTVIQLITTNKFSFNSKQILNTNLVSSNDNIGGRD